MTHNCHTCAHKFEGPLCKYGNAERILRLEKFEPCPFWVPIPAQEKYEQFVNEVERKFDENNRTEF